MTSKSVDNWSYTKAIGVRKRRGTVHYSAEGRGGHLATLDDALAVASSALLPLGDGSAVASEDITGEYAVSPRTGSAQSHPIGRFATKAELSAYLASGAVPGVRGDEQTWQPLRQ
jgi:hypothetical protein